MLTKYSSLDLLEMEARDSWLMELTERWLAVEMTLVIPQYGHTPLF
jgi:hypothetical protein